MPALGSRHLLAQSGKETSAQSPPASLKEKKETSAQRPPASLRKRRETSAQRPPRLPKKRERDLCAEASPPPYVLPGYTTLYICLPTTLGIPHLTSVSWDGRISSIGVHADGALGSILRLIMEKCALFAFLSEKCDVWYAFLLPRA